MVLVHRGGEPAAAEGWVPANVLVSGGNALQAPAADNGFRYTHTQHSTGKIQELSQFNVFFLM